MTESESPTRSNRPANSEFDCCDLTLSEVVDRTGFKLEHGVQEPHGRFAKRRPKRRPA
jgi:hypothetical protein